MDLMATEASNTMALDSDIGGRTRQDPATNISHSGDMAVLG